ncbi:DUF4394 domain-containing protein [Mucilaginibacter aquatilis]|nr:DUF4394 domain-containing protein [Mucilaginibacter aquatilis]
MKNYTTTFFMRGMALCGLALSVLLSSCSKDDDDDYRNDSEIVAPNVNVTALLQNNRIASFNAQTSGALTQTLSITGMQTGENMLAIDYRPATGELYGVSSGSRIYIINPSTGAARAVSATPFTPAIDGTAIGIDFNPTVDRLRLVSNNGQNLRLNPEDGTALRDGDINGAAGAKISSVAYTENYAGASSTVLFDIDLTNKKLYKQDPPNNGTLVEVGSLGVDASAVGDFDITPDSKSALAALTVNGTQGLYSIDMSNGKAYKAYSFNTNIVGLAIFTNPVAYAVSGNNELLIFNPASISPVAKAISGVQANEQILGIDFRPLNGRLYGLGSSNRLYTINPSSGVATAVSGAQFSTALSGTSFGFDFNPVADLIRVVSNTGQNLRISPVTGDIAGVDTQLPANTGFVNAAAYTNNFPGATSTVLFTINSQTGKLYKQDPPNAGTMTEIGSLGITITEANGFDISSNTGNAYGIFTVAGTTRFYGINLQTGAVSAGVSFPQGTRGFALGLGF